MMIDFKNPDYLPIFETRIKRLNWIKKNPHQIPSLKEYYRNNIAQFIIDWGTTFDPRNAERGIPNTVPFILMPKQIEWINWALQHWKEAKPGLVEKTRTVGMSWLSVAFACSMCIFYPEMSIGFGSRKQDYVDKIGDLDSLLQKARMFVTLLPKEFRGGFDITKTSKLMLLKFPETKSSIKGESGDGIGRGGRNSLYFLDEAAFLERPYLIDASLSENTNCRIDISTPNGMANSFAERRHSGKIDVFSFHWRDDLRRDEEWYLRKCEQINNPVIVAQELDINYSASVEGVVIPSQWIQSAIDAHIKLGIDVTGIKRAGWDVADEGGDNNAFCGRNGSLLESLIEWSGVNGDILQSTHKVFNLCDQHKYPEFIYDADGLGAAARGDSNLINEQRWNANGHKLAVTAFRGSASVLEPTKEYIEGRTNQDYFANCKSQAWWGLRMRFQNTHRLINGDKEVDRDNLIFLPSTLPLLNKLTSELSQPTFALNTAGKILINKKPDGTKSPNLADAVMICFSSVMNNINWDSVDWDKI